MDYINFSMLDMHIASLVVNRPDVRNALHWEAMEEFSRVVAGLKGNPEVRVLLISGSGEAFISGADLDLVRSLKSRQEAERLSRQMGETLAELRRLPVISIAVIDGPARGGGSEIAVSCDMRYMSAKATIGFVHARLGLIPGWGGANRLFGLVGYSKGLEYLVSARVIDSAEALQTGLVNGVFQTELLQEEVLAIAQQISRSSWESVKAVKALFLEWEGTVPQERRAAERASFVALWDGEERRRIFDSLPNKGKQ